MYVKHYKTIEPVNGIYFTDDNRSEYWLSFSSLLKEKNALIFLDPDTGLESGDANYLRKMGREKYTLNYEIEMLHDHLDPSSLLIVYQHLPNNKRAHMDAVKKKLTQLRALNGAALVCGYREDDLAFFFLAKNSAVFELLCSSLQKYHDRSRHRLKSIHFL
jgi:hypothetical protein